MRLEKVKIIAIDLVDTLVKQAHPDFETKATEALRASGIDLGSDLFYKTFRKRYVEYSLGNYSDDSEFVSVLAADFRRADSTKAFEFIPRLFVKCNTAFPDATALLEALSTRYRLVLSSNYVSAWARSLLLQNKWDGYFTNTLVSSDCRFRKPAKGFFNQLMQISGAHDPQEILVVGDSLTNDIHGAITCQMQSVLLDHHQWAKPHDLADGQLVAVSLADVKRLLI